MWPRARNGIASSPGHTPLRGGVWPGDEARNGTDVSVQVIPVAADVRDPGAVQQAAETCVNRCGLPHMVVNNAAGNFISPTERLSANAFKTIIDIVLNGGANVALEFGKRLIDAKQGNVCPIFFILQAH